MEEVSPKGKVAELKATCFAAIPDIAQERCVFSQDGREVLLRFVLMANEFYCFSHTVTLLNGEPSGFVPLAEIVNIFPSFETVNFVVSAPLPPRLKFTTTVLGSTFLLEIMSAPFGTDPVVG